MTNAQTKLKTELTELIMSEPFWASLALRLNIREDANCKTVWTDGTTLGYNAEYIEALKPRQVRAHIALAVAKCANGHPWRRETREPKKYDKASNLALAGVLKSANFELPAGIQSDAQYDGLSVEAIYSTMPEPPEPPEAAAGGGDEAGDPAAQPGPVEIRDGEEASEETDKREEWAQAVLTAARQAGKVPAGLERAVTEAKSPNCRNVIDAVLEWAGRTARDDYTWRRPNTRYLAQGLYLPSLYSPAVPKIAAGIDTSGSINDDSLTLFVGAMQRVLDEVNPEALTVLACDTKVHTVHEYSSGDDVRESYPGRGGTEFGPVFERLEGEDIAGCLYLTDLEPNGGKFPPEPPYPVLWVVHDPYARRKIAPYGETLYLA